MERPFLEEEVLKAICDLAGDKTPGPDGFQMKIYQSCWFFMKKDIMAIVNEFFHNNYLDWRLNTTFVALVPKKEGEKEIKDFRPISLLLGIYKIIGKMMA